VSGNLAVTTVAADGPEIVSGECLGHEQQQRGWIVSPLFDICFFANFYWVLAFLPIYASADGTPYIQFWMAYFLATPHRWLTLLVAVSDRDRRYGQTWLFVAIAILVAALIGLTLWMTGDFRSLFLFYTLVLGWHFAGQHTLVLKIYSGKSVEGIRWMESWLPMVFVVYANIRLVAFFEHLFRFQWLSILPIVDVVILAIPIILLGTELAKFSRQRLPKLLYMSSFLAMWSAVLWTAHLHRSVLCTVLLAAVTVYHSVEYLAMVSYYAWHRREMGSNDMFRMMARNWTIVFTWYVVGCGLLYSIGNALFVVVCYAINTWASLLHCAYDGLMWRVRDPDTARTLGIESGDPYLD
jgi:hypothetical protein